MDERQKQHQVELFKRIIRHLIALVTLICELVTGEKVKLT